MRTHQSTVQKVYYLLFFSSLVCLFPYFNLYFQSLGFTEHQIGVLTSLRPWLSAFAGNMVSSVADALHLHRPIFVSGYCLSVVLRCMLGAASGFGVVVAIVVVASLLGEPVYILADTATVSYAGEDEGYFGSIRLWGAVGWGALSPLAGLLIDHFGLKAAFVAYGSLAACAAVPVMLMDFGNIRTGPQQVLRRTVKTRDSNIQLADVVDAEEVIGLMDDDDADCEEGRQTHRRSGQHATCGADSVNEQQLPSDAGALQMHDAVQIVAAHRHSKSPAQAVIGSNGVEDAESLFDPKSSSTGPEVLKGSTADGPHGAQGVMSDMGGKAGACGLPFHRRILLLLSDPEMLLFLSMALVMGYGVGTIDGYLFLFLRQQGASALLMGTTLTITCLLEVPVFHYSGAILRMFGVYRVLHVVLAAFLLRLLAYACLPYYPPWGVLPVELLHGITFGCAWSAGLWNAKRLALPGTEATTQAMFQSLYMGLGHGIGGLAGGMVYSAAGLQMVFISAAVLIAAAWGVIVVAHLALHSWQRAGARQSVCPS